MSDINKALNKGIIHSLLGKYALYVFQILSLAILARLFTPAVFGTLAALQVAILFFQLLATSGLGPAVIHRQTFTDRERDGIFSATILIGSIAAIIFALLTPGFMLWLGLGHSNLLAYVLAINVFFSALAMLPLACLQRDSMFLIIGKAEVLAELIAFLVCIIAYLAGGGIYALALKLAVSSIARFGCYYYFSAGSGIGRPACGLQLNSIVPLWQIAKYQLAFAVVNFFSRNLDTLLVTKYFGISTVGFYEKTYQVMRYPLQLFTFAINPALQPVLTRYRHEPSVILSSYYQLAFKLACLGLVTAVIMFWCATDIVFILFGPQWHSAARLLQILALSIPLQMVLSSTGGVYQAMGATKQMFHCGLFSATISVTVIVLGVYLGDIEFMCIGLIVAFAINFIQCFYVLHRSVFKQFSSNDFLRLLFICMLASVNLTMLNVELSIATNYIASMQRIILVSLPTAIGGYLLYRLLQRT